MKRSFFLTALASLSIASASPRLATARTASAPVRIVRRAKMRRVASPGRCADHRRTSRWSSFTAADFA
jgi:hypothetical protein